MTRFSLVAILLLLLHKTAVCLLLWRLTLLVLFVSFSDSAVVGPVDEELDGELDLSEIRAPPLKPIKF
jgi:hypothetical protein